MQYDYHRLKALARETGQTVKDLLVLAPQNDPFYVGTETDRRQAEWFAEVWRRGGFTSGAHLRRLHYWCVSTEGLLLDNGEPYHNTAGCWQRLCQASKAARYLGLVGIADIADHKNPDPWLSRVDQDGPQATFTVRVPELSEPEECIGDRDRFNVCAVQPYHLEVWCEKSTVNDVLLPVCRRYYANLVTGEGEMSIASVWQLVKRVKASGKPTRVFYVSDFDPAGQSMPRAVARKVEWLADREGVGTEIKLCPVVLTRDQVQEYGLPRTPIKDSERRAATFEEIHGEGAVELDALEALHPGELGRILRGELNRYWSDTAANALRDQELSLRQAIRARVREITSRYTEQIAALDSMREELASLRIDDLHRYEPKAAEPWEVAGDPEGRFWLFDSGRGYTDQLAAYQDYAGGQAA